MSEEHELFSEKELKALILALLHGQETFTTEDVGVVFDWAADTRVAAQLLKGTLEGKCYLSVVNGEVVFHSVG